MDKVTPTTTTPPTTAAAAPSQADKSNPVAPSSATKTAGGYIVEEASAVPETPFLNEAKKSSLANLKVLNGLNREHNTLIKSIGDAKYKFDYSRAQLCVNHIEKDEINKRLYSYRAKLTKLFSEIDSCREKIINKAISGEKTKQLVESLEDDFKRIESDITSEVQKLNLLTKKYSL